MKIYNLLLSIITSMIFIVSTRCQVAFNYKIRSIVDYEISFSDHSNVTLVFTSCNDMENLKKSLLSFLYYNTFPLKSVVIVDRCLTSSTSLQSVLPPHDSNNSKWFQTISFAGNELEAFQKAFELVKTKYIVNMLNKWITFDGMGYVQQAIDAIEYGEQNNIKISQVTSLFLLWKNYRSLGKRITTTQGTIFHQIRTFKPAQRYYFTLNNCVMNFDVVFNKVMGSNILQFCNTKNCFHNNDRQCCQKALGKVLHQQHQYIQVFIDDGSIYPTYFENK